ncbi:MAG: carbamoyltransferase HypF [Thermoguttaceae bacterium]
MTSLPLPPFASRRLAITVRGVVQGVGFRPFLSNAARSRGLCGWVRNEASTVQIEVQGDATAVEGFVEALRHEHPPQACLEAIEVVELPTLLEGEGPRTFEIRPSEGRSAPGPTIPADLATCPECLAELFDPAQRRYRYPFTNCTNCGPRWSIIERLPYDRPRTSMASFPMCDACRAEYENPADRRFHAQPVACPRCGPTLQLLDRRGHELATGEAALAAAVAGLAASQIVALKGLGGFQLLADATAADPVARLRERKHRPDRPFAVMLPSLDAVRLCCDVSSEEARMLTSHQAPIVLLHRLATSGASPCIVAGVAPGNPNLGVMLPYTPLHHLLMADLRRPVVCTSGNLSEEPMVTDTLDAVERLGPIADLILTHNRPIVRPVDDSIVRIGVEGPQMLRRARGFAPLPIRLHGTLNDQTVLAVGGHLKNTVALALGARRGKRRGRHLPPREGTEAAVILSAHIGDLDSVPSVSVFRRAIDDLVGFFDVRPDAVACDLHPDYASTGRAEELSAKWGVPLVRVQHHHAHVAACMAEHGLTGPVLGFSWDGTGYGPDGTIWGGEALVCQAAGYRRVAHLRPFALPGGDRAVRQPRRSALGALFEMLGPKAAEPLASLFRANELPPLLSMLQRRLHSPRTSSMGRLFDAVAALCGFAPVISFEGQAAMALEYPADATETASYPLTLSVCHCGAESSAEVPSGVKPPGGHTVLDWRPTLRVILADRAAGVPVGRISARFHNTLADMALAVAQSLPERLPVALVGGCFQNVLLADRVRSRLSDGGFQVYTNHRTPPGDGGISLGQIFVALHGAVVADEQRRNDR